MSQGITLTEVRSQCTVDHGVITLSPLSAQLFGGAFGGGSLRVDTRHQPAAVDLTLKLQNVDANQLLSAVAQVKEMLFGRLDAAGDLHLLAGAGTARSLNGNVNLNLLKGRLAGTSVLKELSAIGRFAGLTANTQNFTNIAQLDGGSLSAAGTANLADDTLNMKITAVLEKPVEAPPSPQAGDTSIGGYLTTALLNGKGEMVIPAIVTGTFAKPRFAPDAARMAELKRKNILPSVTGPGGIQGILSNPQGTGRSIPDALSGRQPATSDSPVKGRPARDGKARERRPEHHRPVPQEEVTGRNRPSDRIAE